MRPPTPSSECLVRDHASQKKHLTEKEKPVPRTAGLPSSSMAASSSCNMFDRTPSPLSMFFCETLEPQKGCCRVDMGIKQLMTLISDVTPQATRETELKNLFGRTIAMDASMALYSFMIAIRPDSQYTLQDDSGEGVPSGFFSRAFFFAPLTSL